MESIREFRKETNRLLTDFGDEVLHYNTEEFWLVQAPYEQIEFYAAVKKMKNTLLALPLARGLHDGTYRKSVLERDGKMYKQPYLIHPLMVTEMLVDLQLPLEPEEEDVLLAAALCHDMIEDIPFEHHGRELYEKFHMSPRVYETVKKVSKRKDFTEEEENAFFHGIEEDRLALLIKLSDRSNNVEDLYNMKTWKVHEYVGETRKRYLPMIEYGINRYPELGLSFEFLRNKILTLTNAADVLAERYSGKQQMLEQELALLQAENASLREEWQKLWNA